MKPVSNNTIIDTHHLMSLLNGGKADDGTDTEDDGNTTDSIWIMSSDKQDF